jgi:hypothetical protein
MSIFFGGRGRQKNQKNSVDVIPHYVGGSCFAVYPPTRAYARSILLIYKCWIREFDDGKERDFLKEFEEFISSDFCPMKVKIPFERVPQRVMTKSEFKEPTSQIEVVDYSQFSLEISKENEDAVAIASTFHAMEGTEEKIYDYDYDTGQDYDYVRQWIESFEGECEGEGDFEHLRLTVMGVAGSGKSTFIHTIVTAIR